MSKELESIREILLREIENLPLEGEPTQLYLPVAYCLKNGGKRIRPLMTLLAADLFGADIDRAMPAALGMELFHNFTLMHDDIMDEAPMRRNQPTVHAKWNTNTAILSGDVMFALAYRSISQVPSKHLKAVMELFNKTVIQVCEGQQYDMDFETMEQVGETDYLNMIRLKTAVLPAACLQAGAIIGEADKEDQERIYRFGEAIGMAFQLRDDWLDVFGDENKFGKKSGGDIVANKKTWLYIKASELAGPEQREILKKAFSSRTGNSDEKIGLVRKVYRQLGIDELAQHAIKNYHARAMEHLQGIRVEDQRKEHLRKLAGELSDRKH